MSNVILVLLLVVAGVLAVIEVVESRGLSKIAWAVTIIAVLLLFTQLGLGIRL